MPAILARTLARLTAMRAASDAARQELAAEDSDYPYASRVAIRGHQSER